MANRVIQAKIRKWRGQRMKAAKKVFPSNYNNYIKASQGPDNRIAEYYKRTRELSDNEFTDRPTEYKCLFQTSRLQKLHEYHTIFITGQNSRGIKYYFGGDEHFFVRERTIDGMLCRQRSIIYSSKEQAMLYYSIPDGIHWEETIKVK